MKKLNIKNKILFIFALIAVFAIGGFFNLKEVKAEGDTEFPKLETLNSLESGTGINEGIIIEEDRIAGNISIKGFHYEIREGEVILEVPGLGGKIGDKNITGGELLNLETIGSNKYQSKNFFTANLIIKTEKGDYFWETEGAIIEGIERNYFVANVIEAKGDHLKGIVRLTGDFSKDTKKEKSLELEIKTHEKFFNSDIETGRGYGVNIDSPMEIPVPDIKEGTDPRAIWHIPEEYKEYISYEFYEDKDNIIYLTGKKANGQVLFYLNNTNTGKDEVEKISYVNIEVIAPKIKLKGEEVVRVNFGEEYKEEGCEIIGGAKGIDLSEEEETKTGFWYKVKTWWDGDKKPDTSVIGDYVRKYQYEDHYGNKSSEIQRTIKVLPPGTATEDVKIPVSEGEGKLEGAVSMDAGDGNMSVIVSFPEDLTITGGSDWDGVLQVPTVVRTPVQPSPSSGMRTENVYSIEVGGNTPLLFDKPVKITFTGKAGHLVGWSRDGVFTPVTNICNPADGSGLGEGGADCKIDSGRDLVVWTRHMTVYTTYTESSIPRIGYRPPVESITTITPIVETAPEGQVLGAEKYNFTLLLKTGSRGTEVEELQKFLNDLGFDCGKVDGIFGKNTFAGVIAYQLSNKLKVDGIVGPETRGFLNK